MGYYFLDLAAEVLERAEGPLTFEQIWDEGCSLELDKKMQFSGDTPERTLGSRLYVDVKKTESKFNKTNERPARFYLKSKAADIADRIQELPITENGEDNNPRKATKWSEGDLHPLLTYFVYKSSAFRAERDILTKTIHHQKSKKGDYSDWLYPDLVGAYLPNRWENSVIELGRLSPSNCMKLYSFELKRSLDKKSCRAAFFQAVSNSSWANEGYLVAANIKRDDDLLSELQRLNSSFGIGIIDLRLNTNDFLSASSILFPAAVKPNMDWQTMNKICERNEGFGDFLQSVKTDFESKKRYKDDYEKIIPDPNKYIKQHKMHL